ncbi:DUF1275 family protein [Parvimonas sp. G1604]|uniref:DUF1275 family protein n=1 Tax=Parvimonas sp. G1604 TaxID=3388845 RepID=UPI003CFEE916
MKKAMQMSESIELAIFLALSGGLMDAYSYLLRGQVFANAQTGNMFFTWSSRFSRKLGNVFEICFSNIIFYSWNFFS